MEFIEMVLIVVFGVPIISLSAFGLIAADVMQREENEKRRQVEARRLRLENRRARGRLRA